MSTSVLGYAEGRTGIAARAADYIELTKPRIATLVLVTTAVAAFVARWGAPSAWPLVHALIGTALVAASASAFNQWLERHTDALMQRTAERPLPAGRLSGGEVWLFGCVTILAGVLYLGWLVNVATAVLGLATWFLYAWVYTPLKSRTPANTAVGAVAGALPVLMGWASTGAPLGIEALTLFLIVYLWQFPHFMAIAWIYRRQYAEAGLKMLPVVDATGRRAGLQAVVSAMALLPISVLPVGLQLAGTTYLVGVLLLGVAQLAIAVSFFRHLDEVRARRLLKASLVYLPAVMFLLMLAQVV
jgi:protoheme IX farnesyltransferase